MTKICNQPSNHTAHTQPEFQQPEREVDFAPAPAFAASPFQPLHEAGSELATCEKRDRIQLDLETLSCYEVVDRQFQNLGVTFTNAVALHPSNPAFPARSGTMVLMGAPRSGWLQATFMRPVRFVSGFVTSSRATVLAAYDHNNQPVAQTKSSEGNLVGSNATPSPHIELSLDAENIHRITFYTFDGQLTLDDFSFGF